MKKVIFILILNSIFIYSQIPKINWKIDTKDNSFGQSAAADLDGDGFLEIVFSTYRNDSCVYCLNAEDGSILWKKNLGGCGDVAPLIYDVDDDGKLDVIVAGSCNPKTFCFEGKDGTIKWIANTRGSDSPPTISDFNKDGKKEILHGEFGGYLISIDAKTGKVNWDKLIEANSWIQTAPTVCNLNNDGYPDYVVASWNFDKKSSIYAYSGKNDSLLWKNSEPQGYFYHGTAVADLNGDGIDELLLGCYDGNLYVLNSRNGEIIWKYTDNNFYTPSPITISDLDKDGKPEILFSNYYYITCLTIYGELKWKYKIKDYGQCFRGVALSDIDGDNYLDVVFGDNYGILYALKGQTGDTIWTMNLTKEYGDTLDIDHAPLIADFNKDGLNDIFIFGGHANYPDVSGNYGRGYMITAGKGKGPQWLMFQLNPERNSYLKNDYLYIDNSVSEDIPNISPNPTSDYIEINNVIQSEAKNPEIEIFNVFGEKVEQTFLSVQTGQTGMSDPLRIDISNLPAGVYFIKIGERFEKFVKW